MKKAKKIWKLLAPVVVLVSVCLVITTALAFTNEATAPAIAAAEQAKADAAMQIVLPDGQGFQLMEGLEGLPSNVLPQIYEASNDAGYVIFVTGKGFGGDMSIIAGISGEGKLVGTRVLTHAETEGIGTKVVSDGAPFQEQLVGMSEVSGIQATSGATVSSNGMKAALQSVFDTYTILTGGSVEVEVATKPAVLTDAILEAHYPGVTFTEVPGGMVSGGGTVVFGQALGMASTIHVAVFFDSSDKVLGAVADTLDETEYIGDGIGRSDFMEKFVGITADAVDDIQAVSGATLTSTAVKDAVKQAIFNLNTVKGAA